jgi:Acetyltransferase (GNAT) domain
MFDRSYMEYHSDRFEDHSLLFFSGETLVAVMPANLAASVLHTHQGLTFGGLIIDSSMKAATVLAAFDGLIEYACAQAISQIFYKRIPSIYHQIPADEDLYALFKRGFSRWRCDLSTSIDLSNRLRYSDSRKSIITRAKKNDVLISESKDIPAFWCLLEKTIALRHDGAQPTHSASEMQLLAQRFPERITLYCAHQHQQLLAGALVYRDDRVVHTQYLASDDAGRSIGALDFLLDHLIATHASTHRYFDFGTSNENNGAILNEGLIFQKEGFGARGIAHEFFRWDAALQ